MPDESKLPKWAQVELRVLRGEIGRLERDLSAFTKGEETRTIVDPYSEKPYYIPDMLTIHFCFDSGEIIAVSRDDRRDGVRVSSVGLSAPISVHPEVSNVVSIRIAK